MMRFLTFILCLVTSGSVVADNGERLASLQQLCIADDGTGFNWRNGGWVQTRFITPKYIVTKVEIPASWEQAEADDNEWAYFSCNSNDEEYINDTFMAYNACLKVQRIGDEWPAYHQCTEYHSKMDNGLAKWIVSFACNRQRTGTFFMKPNGHFHMSIMHGDLAPEPEDDYKDSLVIYVGKCASIAD